MNCRYCKFTGGNQEYCGVCGDIAIWERENRRQDTQGFLCLLLLLLPCLAIVAAFGNVSDPAIVLFSLVVTAIAGGLMAYEWML